MLGSPQNSILFTPFCGTFTIDSEGRKTILRTDDEWLDGRASELLGYDIHSCRFILTTTTGQPPLQTIDKQRIGGPHFNILHSTVDTLVIHIPGPHRHYCSWEPPPQLFVVGWHDQRGHATSIEHFAQSRMK